MGIDSLRGEGGLEGVCGSNNLVSTKITKNGKMSDRQAEKEITLLLALRLFNFIFSNSEAKTVGKLNCKITAVILGFLKIQN